MLSTTGSLASTVGAKNPIRYRGYYYDTETGLYSIGPRYYDPEVGRWINPDVVAENGNLYAYCQNDPVNRTDESGYLSQKWKTRLIKIAIGTALAVAAVAITVATGGAAAPVIAGIAQAVVIGGVIGGGVAAISHRVGTGSWDGVMDAVSEGILDGMIDGYMFGSAAQLIGAVGNAYSGTSGAMSMGKGTTTPKTASQSQGENLAGKGNAPMQGGPINGTYIKNGADIAYYNGKGQQFLRIDVSHAHGGIQPHAHHFEWWQYNGIWRY